MPSTTGTSGYVGPGFQQFVDANGNPLAGGTITHYTPNTSTIAVTYQDPGLTTPNPDTIVLDAVKNEINLSLSADVISERLKSWKAAPPKEKRGTLAKYAKLVSSASEGAVTDGD